MNKDRDYLFIDRKIAIADDHILVQNKKISLEFISSTEMGQDKSRKNQLYLSYAAIVIFGLIWFSTLMDNQGTIGSQSKLFAGITGFSIYWMTTIKPYWLKLNDPAGNVKFTITSKKKPYLEKIGGVINMALKNMREAGARE